MIKKKKEITEHIKSYLGIAIGAFLAAASIRVFLFPNQLIDGGVVGVSLICGRLLGEQYISLFLLLLNAPFVYLAYKYIRKNFVIQMFVATVLFAIFLAVTSSIPPFLGESIEVIVIGGAILGIGAGLIIRHGGCTDGTEISAILMNRKYGFTVGQIVLFFNIFIFGAYGWIFLDWHIAVKSLLTYIVAFKMIDFVIEGLDEVKSVMILTSKPDAIKNLIMNELGLGLTVIPGIGGFSGKGKDILFVIVERLDLSELKEIVLGEDPMAFMAIENLHEVAYGKSVDHLSQKRKKPKKSFLSKV